MAVETSAQTVGTNGTGVSADRRGLGAMLCAASALATLAVVAVLGVYMFTGGVDGNVIAEDAEQLDKFAPAAGPADNN